MRRTSRATAPFALILLAAAAADAAAGGSPVPLTGNVSDGAGGPLLSGVVYHAVGGFTVPSGTTLTVQAGAIVKFGATAQLDVHGTLDVDGTAASPAVFTSLQDDAAGGDTNGDGPSTAVAGQWLGVRFFSASDASAAEHLIVRFGGGAGWPQVALFQADVTLTDCVIASGALAALDLSNGSFPTVTGCSFTGNAGQATIQVPIGAVAGFLGNTAAGNLGGDFLDVTVGTTAADLTIGPEHLLDGVLVLSGSCTVSAGTTLTLEPGVVVKMRQTNLAIDVYGTLAASGTASMPIVVTSFADDAFGGDTNRDGASTGSPSEWLGMRFNALSDASLLEHVIVRNGGNAGWAGILLGNADVTLRDCTVERIGNAGLDLLNVSRPTVERCSFFDNDHFAVRGAPIDAVPGFLDCEAAGNGGDFLDVTVGTVSTSASIGPENLPNGVLVLGGWCTVPAGTTLALEPGVVVKMRTSNLGFDVYGTLLAGGTAEAPIVVTSFADDGFAGDTNLDGPSTGSPQEWVGMRFNALADASHLEHVIVRNGGGSGWPGILLGNADATLRDCTIERMGNAGLDLSSVSRPTVERCSFHDNALVAVRAVPIDAVPGFLRCEATGNAGGDHLSVTQGTVSGHPTIGLSNLIEAALVLETSLVVPVGTSLTLLPGVVVKFSQSNQIVDAFGELLVRGSGARPVVFTSLTDDDYAGDTNGDGPSAGAGAEWAGLRINAGSASVVEYARVRYGGSSGWPNLQCHSAQARLRSVRIDRSGFTGFYVTAHLLEPMFNLVAFDCAGAGILLGGGDHELAHATSVGNGGIGIWRIGSYAGLVTGSISWGNLGGNFSGFGPTQVVASNGDPNLHGVLSNLFQVPGFVDEAGGDLRLTHGSAMLDHADLAYGSVAVKDHVENSRLLDDDINSVALPDMGAYELAFWEMTVEGEPLLGETLTLTVDSFAGLSIYLLGFLDGIVYTQPYGFITAGAASLIVLGAVPVGTPVEITLPSDPAFAGLEIGVQSITFPFSTFAFGSVTNLYRDVLLP